MNYSSADYGNFSKLEPISSQRQGKFLGPLFGFFLATIFPNLAIARLQHGSIKFQYDPVPQYVSNPPSITIFQHPPSTWEPATKPPEELLTNEPHIMYSDPEVTANNDYIVPAESQKVTVKRSASPRYLNYNRRINRYSTTRRRFPEYDYLYDYLANPRLRNRIRNQGRRPIGFDDDYAYDYDYGIKAPTKRKQPQYQQRRNKNRNKIDRDYYSSDEDLSNEVETITNSVRPRQRQTTTEGTTTTTTEGTTMPSTTVITNGTTPSTTTTTNQSTGYGYGPNSGNENISITYGPPSAIKPVYGPPSSIYGPPISDWAPSYPYESPSSYYSPTSFQSPSISQSSPFSPSVPYPAPPPSTSYGSPTYSKPYATPSSSYGPPSTSYGVPGPSYGVPSQTYGAPSQSSNLPTASGPGRTTYQSYQLPFSSWYGKSSSRSDVIRKAQDIIRLD
ncbi:uncharacterized protein LOC126748676 [Anthonomus grandis grandis]|uniref:uncharacterized protein LOC126748676 n=1 Tax=Anthonomus grandis grandis TaxID=2921223 RepID=UPI0021658A44|nr:uncharacterized protein LOC126748676 [Anthonomus grandis grandis]